MGQGEHVAPKDWVSYKLQYSDLVSIIVLTLGTVGPPPLALISLEDS